MEQTEFEKLRRENFRLAKDLGLKLFGRSGQIMYVRVYEGSKEVFYYWTSHNDYSARVLIHGNLNRFLRGYGKV